MERRAKEAESRFPLARKNKGNDYPQKSSQYGAPLSSANFCD